MTRDRSVVLLEFNELTPALIERFIHDGHLPNFARMQAESQVYTTDAEESGKTLNPWIQWVTVHSGMSYADHGVFHLGDGHKLDKACIWDVASAAGQPVWVCGSMNVRYDRPTNGYVLPDPWSRGATPYPESLSPYFRFVQRNVQEYTNDRVPLSAGDYLKFLRFMVANGLSASTVAAIVRQLAVERMGRDKWKRAVILDRLQWDVFRAGYRRLRPRLSTFFLNSTAHLQHAYWRNMEPEQFEVQPSAQEQSEYQDAVLFGYQQMDRLVGQFLKMMDDRTTLILSTAMSQQPCVTYEGSGGKRYYRPKDFDALMTFLQVPKPYECSPVMSEEFHLTFPSEAAADEAARRLEALTLDGRPAMKLERRGQGFFTGCAFHDTIDEKATVQVEDRSAPFYSLFYQPKTVKSGMHHPDGVLWIRRPERTHTRHAGKVSLRSIAPTVLSELDLTIPEHMTAPVLGTPGTSEPTAAAPRAAAGAGR